MELQRVEDRLVQEVEEQLDLVRCGNASNEQPLARVLVLCREFVGWALRTLRDCTLAQDRGRRAATSFATIPTPHLGVSNNTYVAIPRWAGSHGGDRIRNNRARVLSPAPPCCMRWGRMYDMYLLTSRTIPETYSRGECLLD
jgi:hypothetical protein